MTGIQLVPVGFSAAAPGGRRLPPRREGGMSGSTERQKAAQWNAMHPVGTRVRAWPGARVGDGIGAVTEAPAGLLGEEAMVYVRFDSPRPSGNVHDHVALTHVAVDHAAPELPDVLAPRRLVGAGTTAAGPLLFLDIEGVLNSSDWERFRTGAPATEQEQHLHQLDPAACALLRGLVEPLGCRMVVTSPWRYTLTLEQMAELIALRGGPREGWLDVTPRHERVKMSLAGTRGDEIRAWRRAHPEETGPFAIVDDESDLGDLQPHLVRTDWKLGLTVEDVERLRGLLVGGVMGPG